MYLIRIRIYLINMYSLKMSQIWLTLFYNIHWHKTNNLNVLPANSKCYVLICYILVQNKNEKK